MVEMLYLFELGNSYEEKVATLVCLDFEDPTLLFLVPDAGGVVVESTAYTDCKIAEYSTPTSLGDQGIPMLIILAAGI